MAVVNSKSILISNYDASPRVLSSGYMAGGSDTIGCGIVAAAATDSIGSTYRFGFIPSGVRIQDIQIQNDATTAGVWQLGVYCNTQQGGIFTTAGVPATAAAGAVPVANANVIFGTGISTVAAQLTWKSVFAPTILAGANAAANNSLRVWELLGLSVDPFYEFHLVLTSTTAPTAVGSIALQWSWIR
jgi:hypothetical protein